MDQKTLGLIRNLTANDHALWNHAKFNFRRDSSALKAAACTKS